MKVLDLFSGIGGFSLGLERAGMKTIAFCEIEPFCRKVLNKHWPDVPVFDDIRNMSADDLPEKPDLICGGYPCQPFSVAGKQRGEKDDRHLWPEMYRIIQSCRPTWVIAENVAGHISMGLDQVLFDLEAAGYEAQPFVIPACGLNAPHKRERVWIVGYAEHDGSSGDALGSLHHKAANSGSPQPETSVESEGTGEPSVHGEVAAELPEDSNGSEAVADCRSSRVQAGIPEQKQRQERKPEKSNYRGHRLNGWTGNSIWSTEPAVGRVVDGFPGRVDRIKSLGNAVVPQIPELIGRAIQEISK